jgi:hypothetical protein
MSTIVQARMKIEKLTIDLNCAQVTLAAVYSSNKADPNYSYSQATPSGAISLTITNKPALQLFIDAWTTNATLDISFEVTRAPVELVDAAKAILTQPSS